MNTARAFLTQFLAAVGLVALVTAAWLITQTL
jgi:hypothetical protein